MPLGYPDAQDTSETVLKCSGINTGITCFIVLCFIALHRYCVSYKLKVCGNRVSSKSIGAVFPTGANDG